MVSKNETAATSRTNTERIDWVDYAKGICIIMVVMMHSTLGVEAATGGTGFMHLIVAFARPFRMPDFFLISGLFLPLVINRDWRTYLDRKVVHFFYFYLLWTAIQFAIKAPNFAAAGGGWSHVGVMYLETFIEPFGTLWFIYMLPVFFVVTKATLRVPAWTIWIAAALLETAHINTGWTTIDEFAARFVYFYSGYLFSKHVFALAESVRRHPGLALAGLGAWALTNATLVYAGMSEWPVISLALGITGACAIITIATLLASMKWIDAIRYCGEHSIVIYLAFFLPMASTRILLLKTRLITDIGWISLTVTAAGVIGALVIWWVLRNTRLGFLFTRPAMFWIAPPKQRTVLQPAE
ncbi:Inner membrane protein YcfT OS=Afipia felis OX=1035 GN=ycfT PE=4 SV=1 [Afipia felis]